MREHTHIDPDGLRPVDVRRVRPERASLTSAFDRAALVLATAPAQREAVLAAAKPKDTEGHWVTIDGRRVFISEKPLSGAAAVEKKVWNALSPSRRTAVIQDQIDAVNSAARVAGKPPQDYTLRELPIDKVVPSQHGEDYDNPSSRDLARQMKALRAQSSVDEDAIPRLHDWSPIVVDAENRIVDGNHRHAAHALAGERYIMVLVPVHKGTGRLVREAHAPLKRRDVEATAAQRTRIGAVIAKFVPEALRGLFDVGVSDMGEVHGQYDEAERRIRLNPKIFDDPETFGESPTVDHVTRTLLHEVCHAWGIQSGLSRAAKWLAISQWRRTDKTPPDFMRYVETRLGWPDGPSEWIYHETAWFARPYSAASPDEDWSDSATWCLIGWRGAFQSGGEAKRAYVLAALKKVGGPVDNSSTN